MKVIFLSYYGVLESDFFDWQLGTKNTLGKVNLTLLRNLKRITKKTGAKVVLTISNPFIRENVTKVLQKFNIDVIEDKYAKYIDLNVDIQDFLDHHSEIENFVVISSNAGVHSSFRNYYVKTNSGRRTGSKIKFWRQGLSRAKAAEAIKILDIPYSNKLPKRFKDYLRKRF